MAATPILDALSVHLAWALGDPYTREGEVVTVEDDGLTYTAAMRCQFLTSALRTMIGSLGLSYLQRAGFTRWYGRRFPVTANPVDLGIDGIEGSDDDLGLPSCRIARIYLVTYYGRPMRPCPWSEQEKVNSLLWMNVPMWRVEPGNVLTLLNVEDPLPEGSVIAYAIRDVEDLLPHDPTDEPAENPNKEDILVSSYLHAPLVDLAEVIGRRNHQEAHEYVRARRHEVFSELDTLQKKEL